MKRSEKFIQKINEIQNILNQEFSFKKDMLVLGETLTPFIIKYLDDDIIEFDIIAKGDLDIRQSIHKDYPLNIVGFTENSKNFIYTFKGAASLKNNTESAWDWFVKNRRVNGLEIGFSPVAKKLYYTNDYLNFLDTLQLEVKDPTNGFYTMGSVLHLLDNKVKISSIKLFEDFAAFFSGIKKNKFTTSRTSKVKISLPDTILNKINNKPFYNDYIMIKDKVLSFPQKNNPLLEYFIRKNTPFDFSSLYSFIQFLNKGNLSRRQKLVDLLENFFVISPLKKHLPKLEEAIKPSFSLKKLKSLKELLIRHSLDKVTKFLIEKGYSINDIINLLVYVKNDDLALIGFFESNYRSIVHKDPYLCFLYMKERYLEEREKLKEPLVDPLNIDSFEELNSITELTSIYELEEEGYRMHHCIGGYGKNITEFSRIFHLEKNGDISTLLIVYKDNSWRRKEHRSVANVNPSYNLNSLAKKFINFLNKRYRDVNGTYFKYVSFDIHKECVQTYSGKNQEHFQIFQEEQDLFSFYNRIKYLPLTSIKTEFDKFLDSFSSYIIILLNNNSAFEPWRQEGYFWSPLYHLWWTSVPFSELENESGFLRDFQGPLEIDLIPVTSEVGRDLIDSSKEYFRKNKSEKMNKKQKLKAGRLLK